MPDRRTVYFILTNLTIAVLLITLPYLFAAKASGGGYVFGGFLTNPIDGNSYLAKMYQGWEGYWQVKLPYTSNPGEGAYLFLFYIFLGHIARITGINLIAIYHTARVISSIFMFICLYRFFRYIFNDLFISRWSFLLATFGSGSGWLGIPFGLITSDFWVAEAFPFLSAYTNPHFPLGLALLLWLITPDWYQSYRNRKNHLAYAWFVSLVLGIISPFGVISAAIVLSGLLIVELHASYVPEDCSIRKRNGLDILKRFWQYIKGAPGIFYRWLGILLGGSPVLFYYWWVVQRDPVWAAWNAQNQTPAPSIVDFIVSFSPVLLLALLGGLGLMVFRSRKWWKMNFVKGKTTGSTSLYSLYFWAGTSLLLLFIPFNLQRRFLMGLYIPLAGLAVLVVNWLASHFRLRFNLLMLAVLILSLPTNLLVILAARQGIHTHDPQIYLSDGEVAAFTWIEQQTSPQAVILSGPDTGLFIPAYTGRRVIYGHPYETIDAAQEKGRVTRFFQGIPDKTLLSRVDYIYVGPREMASGNQSLFNTFQVVYQSDGISIYKIPK
jgi:hypothetical protein